MGQEKVEPIGTAYAANRWRFVADRSEFGQQGGQRPGDPRRISKQNGNGRNNRPPLTISLIHAGLNAVHVN